MVRRSERHGDDCLDNQRPALTHEMESVVLQLVLKGMRRLFAKGPKDTARWVRYHLHERYREWSLGIDTAGSDEWKASLQNPLLHVYEPLSYEAIDAAFRAVEIRPGEDVLLDYGCGKGRIIIVGATHLFRRVIGIELLPELAAIARQNLTRAGKRLNCPETEVVTTDATTYEVPPDVSVIFLFNPFRGDVLRKVQSQIHLSWLRHRRELTIVYMNPVADEDFFATCDWLSLQTTLPTMWTAMRLVIYRSLDNSLPRRESQSITARE